MRREMKARAIKEKNEYNVPPTTTISEKKRKAQILRKKVKSFRQEDFLVWAMSVHMGVFVDKKRPKKGNGTKGNSYPSDKNQKTGGKSKSSASKKQVRKGYGQARLRTAFWGNILPNNSIGKEKHIISITVGTHSLTLKRKEENQGESPIALPNGWLGVSSLLYSGG